MTELMMAFIKFCEGDDEPVFHISERLGKKDGGVFVKMPITKTIVAIFFMTPIAYNRLISNPGRFGCTDYIGFFSTTTNKFYVAGSHLFQVFKSLDMVPMPHEQIQSSVINVIVSRIRGKIVIDEAELASEEWQGKAFDIFMEEEDIPPIFDGAELFNRNLTVQEIEEYLSNPTACAETIADRLMKNQGFMKYITERLAEHEKLCRILDSVQQNKNHVWHVLRNICDATYGADIAKANIEYGGKSNTFHVLCLPYSLFENKQAAILGKLSSKVFPAEEKEKAKAFFGAESNLFLFDAIDIKTLTVKNELVYERD